MAAAGGLAVCGSHALLIRKHGLWDIPKGKLKRRKGETPERCAVREIAEETGVEANLLKVRRPLCQSSYISYYSGKPFAKTVHWFVLDYRGRIDDPLQPDLSENIDLCRWVAIDDLPRALRTARPYLRSVATVIGGSLHLLRSRADMAESGIPES